MTNNVEHKRALRRFHALCSQLGISGDDKRAIIEGQGVESSADLPTYKLEAICNNLVRQADPRIA